MIIEVKIPDEVYERYGQASEALVNRLVETAGMDIDPKLARYILNQQQISDLTRHFGPFKDAADLIKRIQSVGTVKVQGRELQLDADQIQNARVQAYFYAEDDEPRSEQEAIENKVPKAIQKRVINRYLDKVLKEALDIVLGLN